MPWAEQGVEVEEEAALTPAQPAQMPAELTQLSGWYGTSTAAAQLQITDEGVLTLTGVEGTFTYREDGSFRDESDSVLLKLVQEDNGETYLYQKSYASIPGLTTLCVASYAMSACPATSRTRPLRPPGRPERARCTFKPTSAGPPPTTP